MQDLTPVSNVVEHLDARKSNGSAALSVLRNVPELASALKKLGPSDTFRVVMTPENIDLFKRAADGTWSPVLRQGGRIREHAKLIRIGPDLVGSASNILFLINMQQIASKLALIEGKVEHLNNVLAYTQYAKLKASMVGIDVGRAGRESSDARAKVELHCDRLLSEIIATTGLLRANIEAIPDAPGSFLGSVFGGEGGVLRAIQVVERDLAAIAEATQVLVETYVELNEGHRAELALRKIVEFIDAAGIKAAITKGRSLSAPKGTVFPEARLQAFLQAKDNLHDMLLTNNGPKRAVSLDVSAEDFDLVPS